ncbi:hypothetical protein [Vibrio cholerae]|uniref:hypothetical protein n=1 Tax=Vibrio cholerae TaxID=666 RepID=UPI0006804125|nr:hypothetical protein [Vibrio cholerae]EGR2118948.1 hypothetical protein [Vibrio cholerae]MBY4641895.1 hypothetical protein [Vibrio cholerae]MCR9658167.1 hypothetical protein [Vibrio cholerae]MCR9688848.1 hypothetical protein [Vibrio cholerae]MCR9737356.1 hypothetical protein [Vibrio cholerae]
MSSIRTRVTVSNFKSSEAQQLVEDAVANGDLNILIREIAEYVAIENKKTGNHQSLIAGCLGMLGSAAKGMVNLSTSIPLIAHTSQTSETPVKVHDDELPVSAGELPSEVNVDSLPSTTIISDDTVEFDLDNMFAPN